MITYFMCKEFHKSEEFDESKNEFAGSETLLRVPMLIVLDILLMYRITEFIIN